MSVIYKLAAIVLLVSAVGSVRVFAAEEPQADFVPLFNGRDLEGWEGATQDAAACWLVENNELVCTGKPGTWLRSTKEFADFELSLEYMLKEGGNSGVYIRVPADGNHHGENAGIEVQILDDNADRYQDLKAYQYSGSLYAIVAAEPRVAKPPGEWGEITLRCHGTNYTIVHNGKTVVQADATTAAELGKRRTTGFLGLQNHNEEVRFRNIRIKQLDLKTK